MKLIESHEVSIATVILWPLYFKIKCHIMTSVAMLRLRVKSRALKKVECQHESVEFGSYQVTNNPNICLELSHCTNCGSAIITAFIDHFERIDYNCITKLKYRRII